MRNFQKIFYHYFSVYCHYFSNNVARAMSFRVNFLLLFFVDLAFYGSSFGSVSFIFDHVQTIGPWNREQFLFFVSFMMAVDQLHMSLFAMSFWELSSDLKEGKLDFLLVKPVGVLFPIFFRHIRVGSMLVFPIPWAGMIYFGNHIGLSAADWFLIPVLVVLAVILLLSIEIFISASMFWTFEGIGINFIRMQLQSVSRWPNFVYGYLFQKTFTFVLPVLLIGSAPVHFLLDSDPSSLMLFMIISILILFLFIRITWQMALRRYESASS